jgi:hypothetical protein
LTDGLVLSLGGEGNFGFEGGGVGCTFFAHVE